MCPVDPQTVRAGDIVILPAELEAGQLAILPMNPRCLNHPMVILAPPDGGKNAEATLVRTFPPYFMSITLHFPTFRVVKWAFLDLK